MNAELHSYVRTVSRQALKSRDKTSKTDLFGAVEQLNLVHEG